MLAVCYINKALLCRDAGQLDEALALYRLTEDQHKVAEDKLDAGKAFLFRGEVHCADAEWQKGLESFGRALERFEESENPLWGARALERIGGSTPRTRNGTRRCTPCWRQPQERRPPGIRANACTSCVSGVKAAEKLEGA